MWKRNAVAAAVLVVAAGALAQSQQKTPDKPTAQMQKVIDAMKALGAKAPAETASVVEARQQPTVRDAVKKVLEDEGQAVEPEKVSKIEKRTITTPLGDLPVSVYTPAAEGPFPGIVYFHGGGFVLADADVYDSSARALANQAKAVVISVDYRRAPDSPFPAALDDASNAFKYVRAHADEFNVQPTKLAVAGESAGANLATGVALRAKKEQTQLPVFQLLIYPFLSTGLEGPSHRANGGGEYLISNPDLAWFWSQYLGESWKKNKAVGAQPLLAKETELRGLPPALIITASLDPLKDGGSAYARKLKGAGVQVKLRNFPGVTHEFFGMSPVVPEAKQAQSEAGAALTSAFAKGGQVGQR